MSPEWPRKDDDTVATDSDARVPWNAGAPGPDRDGGVATLPDETAPSLAEALTTVFGLGSGERDVYRHLAGESSSTTRELARALDRDRSSVNRALSTLLDRGLVTRRPRILDEGGHVYYYTARPSSEVRERLHDGVDAWARTAHDRVDEFVDRSDADAGG